MYVRTRIYALGKKKHTHIQQRTGSKVLTYRFSSKRGKHTLATSGSRLATAWKVGRTTNLMNPTCVLVCAVCVHSHVCMHVSNKYMCVCIYIY